MGLLVERPPAPPAGADWTYTVPGIYLERITGITAQLTTAAVPTTVAHDSSGNGNDGTYTPGVGSPGGPDFTAGLVPGGLAWVSGNAAGTTGTYVDIPHQIVDNSFEWSAAWWQQFDPFYDGAGLSYFHAPSGGILTGCDAYGLGQSPISAGQSMFEFNGGGGFGVTYIGPYGTDGVFCDGLTHHVAYVYSATDLFLYLDGVLRAWHTFPPLGHILGNPEASLSLSDPFNYGGTFDEFAFFPGTLTGGQVAALFAAGTDLATYNAAVMALTPTAYYHFDDVAFSGRTPGLFVTDGTDETLLIPDGFTAQATPGPYQYSWSPTLRAANRDPTGTITSVPLPELILPGGYVLGTRTPDILPGDQWSDVTIWWNDDVQRARDTFGAYLFPGGIRLRYERIGQPA